MRKSSILIATLGLLSLAGMASADIPFFWLDKPTGRSNPNDPNSPNHVLPIAPANTATFTLTPPPVGSTNTFTLTPAPPTLTPTQPPVGSTNTFTLTPAPPTSTNTPVPPTSTNTPVPPTATVTQTPVPGSHGSQVSDSENTNISDWSGGTAGTIYISKDAATTASPDPLVSTAGGSTLPGGTSANAFCYTGSIGNTSASPYPYSVLVYDLAAGWVRGAAGVDLTSYAPANSLTFSIKANVAPSNYKVDLPSMGFSGGDYNYFEYQFALADTSWHQMTVYFPDGAGTPKFAQAYGPFVTWATEKQNVGQVRIQPITSVAGPTTYDFCVDDVTFAAPPTPTPTVTPTNTPVLVPTATNTPVPGFAGIWYDGDSAGAMAADVTFANDTSTATASEQAAGGFAGAYYKIGYTVAAAGYFSSADISRGAPAGIDVSAFNQLEFKIRVPSSTGGCFTGGVQLVGANAIPNDRSRPVTITTYAVGGAVKVDTWIDVKIPLTAFNGDNHQSGTWSAADLAAVTAVRWMPYYNDYNADGSFSGGVDVDNVAFVVGSPLVAEHTVSTLFSDFETNTATNWGNFWSSYNDQDVPDFVCSPGPPSSRVFPTSKTIAPIMTDGAGAPDSPCSYGRFAGHKGGPGDATGCGTNNWSYSGMGAMFDPAGGSASVDIPAALGFTPSGIRFRYKAGPTHPAGQTFLVTLALNAPQTTCGGCEWQGQINPTPSWQTTTMLFPANGTLGTGNPISATSFGQPSWAGTALTWDASCFTLFKQFAFGAETPNMDYDLEVDDIEFVP